MKFIYISMYYAFLLQIGKWRDLHVLWGKKLPQKLGLHIFFDKYQVLTCFAKGNILKDA